jgi:hypothetical protein
MFYFSFTLNMQGGSNMTGTDLCVNKPHKSRSNLNHLVFTNNFLLYFKYESVFYADVVSLYLFWSGSPKAIG